MREIKYRGLNTKGEWVYGDLIKTSPSRADGSVTCWIKPNDRLGLGAISTPTDNFIEVEPETVGQFTGKYCGGDEIYEGDVIEIRFFDDFSNDCVTVEYEEDDPSIYTAKVHWDCAGYWLFSEKDATWFFPQSLDDCANIKVIGNIYENPELLEPAEC